MLRQTRCQNVKHQAISSYNCAYDRRMTDTEVINQSINQSCFISDRDRP